jgi:nucleoside-diphosphate-sugar epimerase
MPLALVGLNALLGIYSKLKTASGRSKAIVLATSVGCICGVFWVLTGDGAMVVLWGMLTAPPLILARLFLNLPYSKHKNLAVAIIKQRGPVLVIGGGGYIGSHVVELLLNDGQVVRVLDRLMYGREALRDFADHRNFELIEGDATDISKLTMAMNGASAVVHLAGLVGDPACAVDPQFTRHANIISTRMAKEVAQSMGIYRFVFASSCSVYGVSDREVKEGDGLNPVSLYAQTKVDSEKELLFSVRDDFFVTILRFATVFGHSRRPRFDLVCNLFTAQAMTDGIIKVIGPNQWRPFIHVRDLARAVLMVLKANPISVQSQIFNVGDRRLNMTILQLAEAVKSCVEKDGRKVTISVQDNIEDRRNYAVSFDKIHTMLGFEAATLLEAGIQEMVENFKQGKYKDYRDQIYSNVAMAKIVSSEFHDPMQSMKLYAPIENQHVISPSESKTSQRS